MAILLNGVGVPLGSDDNAIRQTAAKMLALNPDDIAALRVKRQSVDARRAQLRLVLTVTVELHDAKAQQTLEQQFGHAAAYTEPEITYGEKSCGRPVVVGAGPCGLFAALTLAQHGYKPLLIERGRDMAQRTADVARLRDKGVLDPESNVCFGAGGAGAFSDGKLTTRIKDPRSEYVLQTLADCGAPSAILTDARPHTGTEHIRTAVTGMIDKIRALGGEVCFESRLCDIYTDDDALCRIAYIRHGVRQTVDTRAAVLSIGHSARDTYEWLLGKNVALIAKPFAVGVRIEHHRAFIDKSQYGAAYGHPILGAAEYRLAAKSGARSVYTFCMCPGGEVVCSSTEPDGVAVNGMSYYARDAENSNSAVVVSVSPADFESGALGGIAFQRRLERAAFALTGTQAAPAQTVGDFFAGRATSRFGAVQPSYRPYPAAADLNSCLPSFLTDALKAGLTQFDRKLKGFARTDAVLTGVETRTSSPVRMLRGENLQSETIAGLYPAGEGAGYAGGIVSAAVDGIKCAHALMQSYVRPAD